LLLLWLLLVAPCVRAQDILVEDFESDSVGTIPARWYGLSGRDLVPIAPSMREEGEYYAVMSDGHGKYLKLRTRNESLRLVIPNASTFDWDITRMPELSWRWRPVTLPDGGDEIHRDDTAGAVYVTFYFDWLRRPRSIKYTHSTTLPVGTVVDRGVLQVVVVSSGAVPGNDWLAIERNVLEDYRRLFGKEPPSHPVSIAVWSDSDTTQSESEIDIDDIRLGSGQ